MKRNKAMGKKFKRKNGTNEGREEKTTWNTDWVPISRRIKASLCFISPPSRIACVCVRAHRRNENGQNAAGDSSHLVRCMRAAALLWYFSLNRCATPAGCLTGSPMFCYCYFPHVEDYRRCPGTVEWWLARGTEIIIKQRVRSQVPR